MGTLRPGGIISIRHDSIPWSHMYKAVFSGNFRGYADFKFIGLPVSGKEIGPMPCGIFQDVFNSISPGRPYAQLKASYNYASRNAFDVRYNWGQRIAAEIGMGNSWWGAK